MANQASTELRLGLSLPLDSVGGRDSITAENALNDVADLEALSALWDPVEIVLCTPLEIRLTLAHYVRQHPSNVRDHLRPKPPFSLWCQGVGE